MTMMQRRTYEVDRDEKEKYDFELPVQLEDEEDFEPTIVRGRE